MRHARIKADGAGYYHGMSRIIERRHILGEAEKAQFLTLEPVMAAVCRGAANTCRKPGFSPPIC